MLKLLGTLQLERYSPRSYVVASTDAMGTAKAQAFEQQQQQGHQQRSPRQARWRRARYMHSSHRLLQHRTDHYGKMLPQAEHLRAAPAAAVVDVIPRSREVGQSYLTSVLTTLRALAAAFGVVWRRRPELVSCQVSPSL